MRADVSEENKVYRVMMGMDEGAARWVFFTQGRGGTWDNWDNRFFSFVGNDLVPWVGGHVVFLSVVVGVVAVGVLWLRRRRRGGYAPVMKEMV
jgi:inositol phosphorylceramide mannosyltransferase catalytic subunit